MGFPGQADQRRQVKGISPSAIAVARRWMQQLNIDPEDLANESVEDLQALLGKLDLLFTLHSGNRRAADSTSDRDAITGALNYFENVRTNVAERVVQLTAQQQMAQIRDAVETQVKDPTERDSLLSDIAELESKYAQVVDQLDSYTTARDSKMVDVEVAERRFKMRTSLLEREPAAVIIGGILLALMTIALIGGMYSHTSPPDVLSNAYLLILGFFFGQTVSRRTAL